MRAPSMRFLFVKKLFMFRSDAVACLKVQVLPCDITASGHYRMSCLKTPNLTFPSTCCSIVLLLCVCILGRVIVCVAVVDDDDGCCCFCYCYCCGCCL
jgi:hypothetical protein